LNNKIKGEKMRYLDKLKKYIQKFIGFITVIIILFFFSAFNFNTMIKSLPEQTQQTYQVKDSTKVVGVRGLDENENKASNSSSITSQKFKTTSNNKYEVKSATKVVGVRGLEDTEIPDAQKNENISIENIDSILSVQISKENIELFKSKGGLK